MCVPLTKLLAFHNNMYGFFCSKILVKPAHAGHQAISSVGMRSQLNTVLIITLVPTGAYPTNFNILVMRPQKNSTSLIKRGHFHLCGIPTDHIMCGFEIHNIPFYSASRKSMGNPTRGAYIQPQMSFCTTSKNFCSVPLLRVS